MKLRELKEPLSEATNEQLSSGIRHTLPHAVIIPEMDLYYEFYKFVTNMACHPELENGNFDKTVMRDVPFAVAYTPQEFEMIQATAKRMGFDIEEVAFKGSTEQPGVNTTSPVMKFNPSMFESRENRALRCGKIKEQFMTILETMRLGKLAPEVENTLSPTMTIPELINSDSYKQYRYSLALAAARAVAAGEVKFDAMSAWNEALTGVAYSEAELEIFKMANKLMGVSGVMLSNTPPTEPDDTNKTSPVMKFDMFKTLNEHSKIK